MHTAERLRALFAQTLVPGKDQKLILASIEKATQLLAHAKQHGQREAIRTGLHKLEDLEDRVTRYLLDPRTSEKRARAHLLEIRTAARTASHAYTGKEPRGGRVIINHTQTRYGALGLETTAFTHIPYGYADVAEEDLSAVTDALHKNQLEATIEKAYRLPPTIPSTAETQWNLALIGADTAWEHRRGEGVTVAIADTGCDYTHPEIKHAFGRVKGYDFVNDTDDPRDDNSHGTHVAGTIAGQAVGVAPDASLYALKFLDSHGRGREVDFIRAAEWAIDHEADVLNGSFGSSRASPAEKAICDALARNDVLFAAAAGNGGNHDYHYPASYDSVLSVAAVDRDKRRARFSQRNDALSLSGPGVGIRSCVPGGYRSLDGTSMAAPHVAGALALLYDQGAGEYVRELLVESCEELGSRTEYGAGLVRPDKALGLAAFVARWAA